MPAKLDGRQKKLAEDNIGLIYAVIQSMNLRGDYEEFFSEGCIGLCQAAALWKPDGGMTFAAYACHLIKHQIIDYLRHRARSVPVIPLPAGELCAREDEGYARAESRIFLSQLDSALKDLLDPGCAALIRALMRGADLRKAAEYAGMSVENAYKARARAAALIRRYLKTEGTDKNG